MSLSIKCKEDLLQFFIDELGYKNNPYFNYDKSKIKLNSIDEIKSVHLLSDTLDFKIWIFEMEVIKTDTMNKVASKLYNSNPFEYNLLIFSNKTYSEITFLHYYKEEKEKLKIRRLNIEDCRFTRTDLDILYSIGIKNKKVIDDLDIELEYRKAFDIEEVTKKFFAEFKREIDNIEKHVYGLENKQDRRNYAVLLASRLVFLYFIQKKKWLNGKKDFLFDRYKYCINSTPQLNYFNEILEPLFFDCLNTPMDVGMIKNRSEKAKKLYENFESQTDIICDSQYQGIPYLNGGLFERHPKYEIDTKISIENNVFKEILENLLEKYNFTVREDLGYDADVAVDPELLGRIFENMINSEERKTTGSFYTPRAIISYMCKQSIKEYLIQNLKNIQSQKIIYLIDSIEEEGIYSKDRTITVNKTTKGKTIVDGSTYLMTKDEMQRIIILLDNVKICDPSVGSGAFILGMLQLLVILKKKLNYYCYNKNIDLYETKKEIIKNNLYGVDIQEGATEIAHLRLWLSLAVEYDAKSIEDIKPLPNLTYKIMQGNSLISEFEGIDFDERIFSIKNNIHQLTLFPEIFREHFSIIIQNKEQYFSATANKKQLEKKIFESEFNLIKEILKQVNKFESDEQVEEMLRYQKDMFFSWGLNFSDVFVNKDNNDRGFDIIIGNPPYVNTKDVNKLEYKKVLEKTYGFRDDLYNHFTFKGFRLLKENGTLAFITSNTFLTIQTKLNMRQLLQEKHLKELIITPKAFQALVDTAIFIVRNKDIKSSYEFDFIDATKASVEDFYNMDSLFLKNDIINKYNVEIKIFRNNLMKVFFKPDNINMQIYKKHISKIKKLYDMWWNKISTSREIKNNKNELNEYRENLKAGDFTLLGLITDGGVGLQTGDNGKFVGVIEGSKWAEKIKQSRIKKFYEAIIKKQINRQKFIEIYPQYSKITTKNNVEEFLKGLSEYEIRSLFDDLKEKFGRDVFGQGYLFRIISKEEIADIYKLTDEEKTIGILDDKRIYAPYDKGDKDGNRWYLETPYYINWSKPSVEFLMNNSGKKGSGMPVVRNKDYYFREGFCWTDVNSVYLKSRIKTISVHDVLSMSLFSMLKDNVITEKYIVSLINSKFMSEFVQEFLNGTSHFQINDARKVPVIIPNKKQLTYINNIVDEAMQIKKKQFNGEISEKETKDKLDEIQQKVDDFVYKLYGINI
ncbi:DNA modification methylase [Clostridium novyi A str. NCTC 538]|uniref:site-specific DNA-methyltransferase (adenine-specific) n=2 Tax=Clostridium novyi TaxID=1542 RepID=A0PYD1_CLONN|nr:DNA modification methylase, putative [Clostridium novyi NT]KEH86720.1 DNA modification methylase [Clostridium novyi A str. NCTC 538]